MVPAPMSRILSISEPPAGENGGRPRGAPRSHSSAAIAAQAYKRDDDEETEADRERIVRVLAVRAVFDGRTEHEQEVEESRPARRPVDAGWASTP